MSNLTIGEGVDVSCTMSYLKIGEIIFYALFKSLSPVFKSLLTSGYKLIYESCSSTYSKTSIS